MSTDVIPDHSCHADFYEERVDPEEEYLLEFLEQDED